MRAGAAPRLRPAEPLPHGRARRRDDGRPPARASRCRSASTPACIVVTPANLDTPEVQELLQPAPRHVPEARRMTAALRLAGIVKRFGATVALDGAALEVRAGRGPRAHRRERRRQEHAPRHPGRACSCRRRGRWRWAGAPYAPALAARRARPRHRPDPPGALALPAPHRRREHPHGRRALAPRALGPRRGARAARARCSPSSATPRSTPTRWSGACPSARGRSSRSAAPSRRGRASC